MGLRQLARTACARPLVRTPDARTGAETFRDATWDEALATVAARMRAIADEHGPDSVAFIASSKATNEESYLVQKLARAVFGTNNVDNCSRYCQAPATQGLWRTVGYGGDAGTFDDLRAADLILIVGSNTDQSHPVIAAHLRAEQKRRGQGLIVADLRAHETARRADVFLRPTPGHGPDLALGRHQGTSSTWAGRTAPSWTARQPRGRLPGEPRAVHARLRRGEDRHRAGRARRRRPARVAGRDRRGAVGDGRHAARDGLGHEHGDLEPAARDGQLRQAGHGRLPAARPQQRAGLLGLWLGQRLPAGLPEDRRRRRRARRLRGRVGRDAEPDQRGSTTAR